MKHDAYECIVQYDPRLFILKWHRGAENEYKHYIGLVEIVIMMSECQGNILTFVSVYCSCVCCNIKNASSQLLSGVLITE